MKKVFLVIMMLLLVSCNDEQTSLYQELTTREVDSQVETQSDIIKTLLKEDSDVLASYDYLSEHIDDVEFHSISGFQEGESSTIIGEMDIHINQRDYNATFDLKLVGDALETFSIKDLVILTKDTTDLFELELFEDYREIDELNELLTITRHNNDYTYLLEDVIDYEVIQRGFNINTGTHSETVELYFSTGMMSSNYSIDVVYNIKKDEAIIESIKPQQESLKITPIINLLGRWGTAYRLGNMMEFSVLRIDEYDEETTSYSGKIFRHSWANGADHVNYNSIYDVTLSYNFESDTIDIIAGEISQGFDTALEYVIDGINDGNLKCSPKDWVNETKLPLLFSRDHDTYAALNNKQAMLKTIGANLIKQEN